MFVYFLTYLMSCLMISNG
uniref:Uncharacterized protein n=1 Tax=Rhizophora mucronata TaxID=61149 RepID=A0A2P2PQT0_RHIMU